MERAPLDYADISRPNEAAVQRPDLNYHLDCLS